MNSQAKWTKWKDVDPYEHAPINEVFTPNAIVRFVNDEKTRSVVVRRGEQKPELTFGTKEPRHISIEDPVIPEIVAMERDDFCQAAAYVADIARVVEDTDFATRRTVSQDYERVIEAARMRAAQGVINMDEADAVYHMHTAVVEQGGRSEFERMRVELPA